MRKFRIGFMCFLATLLVAFVAGCGQETVTLPSVVSVTPAQGAANVAINTVITATFSQAMSPASISTTTFTVAAQGGTAVTGTVAYSGTVATFTPGAALAYGTTYTATITTGAATPGGTELIGPYVWSFTTIGASVPFVTSVTPLAYASSVPLTGAGATISATFSQAMTAASIAATGTFTVEAQGGVAVPGSAALNGAGTIATFTPTSGTLAYNTTYTVTITTAAKSLAEGVPLAANFVWTFTTLAPSIPFVSSVTPVQGAANVAVNAPITATFSIAMNPASINGATTFTVYAPNGVAVPGTAVLNGAGTIATFTPTSGTLANNTTYTATITTAATSVGGYPIVANYVWSFTTITPTPLVISTVPVNTATGVPINQVLTARFNVAMLCSTLQSSPSTTFTLTRPSLTGPGTTPVTGSATCTGNVVTFTPGSLLAYNTVYTATISTAAKDLASTPLAAAYQWTFTTVAAPPIAPVVISTVPISGAPPPIVPIGQILSATFNEAMDPATINSATFTLVQTSVPGTPINGVITYVPAGSVATFTPNAPLLYNTNYTATITAGAEDLNDDAFVTAYSWTFTTAATPLVVPPTVISTAPVTLPVNLNVPLNQVVSAVFSKAMNPATINSSNFTLTYVSGGVTTQVLGLVAYAGIGNELVFLPSGNLNPDTQYTATITTGVQDVAGDAMVNPYVWIFTTGTNLSTITPEIISTIPANTAPGVGATGVPLNQAVDATFSEAMNPLTIINATFLLYKGATTTGTPIPATITYDAVNFIATLTPNSPLLPNTVYTATVTNGATDLTGNPLGSTVPSPYSNPWSFTTGPAGTLIVPPVVLLPAILPVGGASGGAGMTNTGINTIINGDVSTTATAFSAFTGFHDDSVVIGGVPQCTYTETGSDIGLVTGTIDTATVSPNPTTCPLEGTTATANIATIALAAANTAYLTLQSNTAPGPATGNAAPGTTLANTELGGTTIYPGTYYSASSVTIENGDLTLDAQGDPNAYWVFQIGSSLTVGLPGTPVNIILANGAKASNIFWAVGSDVYLEPSGGGTFNGTIISYYFIHVSTAGYTVITTVNGRLISLNASTTLVNTVINVPLAP